MFTIDGNVQVTVSTISCVVDFYSSFTHDLKQKDIIGTQLPKSIKNKCVMNQPTDIIYMGVTHIKTV